MDGGTLGTVGERAVDEVAAGRAAVGEAEAVPAPRRRRRRRRTHRRVRQAPSRLPKLLRGLALGALLLALLGTPALLYAQHGAYGVNALLRHGGSWWSAVAPGSPAISPGLRAALRDIPPVAGAGPFAWREAAPGFELAEMPVLADDERVDEILLARIDPARFRLVVRTAPAGDTDLDDWMSRLGAALVVNGSFYGHDGRAETPLLRDGAREGPDLSDPRHGALVARDGWAAVQDSERMGWRAAFAGATDALVSYPLLVSEDGSDRVGADRNWLANRSFVAQDREGRIVIGTTRDAFFSLPRLATFLREGPLRLRTALNLDSGPLACQAVALGEERRRFCGRWETQMQEGRPLLLRWAWGDFALPVVIAAVPR